MNGKSQTLATAFGLLVFGMLWSGCAGKGVIPDPSVPHQVAEETKVVVWCRLPDKKWAKCQVRLLEGWWVAGPPVIEPLGGSQ